MPPMPMQSVARGAKAEEAWKADCAAYAAKYPAEYAEFTGLLSGAPCGLAPLTPLRQAGRGGSARTRAPRLHTSIPCHADHAKLLAAPAGLASLLPGCRQAAPGVGSCAAHFQA